MPLSKNNLILQPTNVLAPSVGAGLKFDGVNDYVTHPSLNVGTINSYSIWLILKSYAGLQVILHSGLGSQYMLGYLNGTGVLINYSGAFFTLSYTIPLDTLTHIAITRNGNNFVLYVNNVPTSATIVTALASVFKDIGMSVFDNAFRTNFILYDLKIYNSVLTAGDIDVLFNLKGVVTPATGNLVAQFGANQKIGTVLFDAQGNNGTLINFAITSPGAGNAWVDDLQNSILI